MDFFVNMPESTGSSFGDVKFMKLKPGENRVRIMSDIYGGFVYWNGSNRPYRTKQHPQIPHDLRISRHDSKKFELPRRFFMMAVWNYDEKAIQIMELDKQRAINDLIACCKDPEWGDPKRYDIKINRTGSGTETEYKVIPCPAKEIQPEITMAYGLVVDNIDFEKIYQPMPEQGPPLDQRLAMMSQQIPQARASAPVDAFGMPIQQQTQPQMYYQPQSQPQPAPVPHTPPPQIDQHPLWMKFTDGLMRADTPEKMGKLEQWIKNEKQLRPLIQLYGEGVIREIETIFARFRQPQPRQYEVDYSEIPF